MNTTLNGNGIHTHPQMITDAEKIAKDVLERHRNDLNKQLFEFEEERRRTSKKIVMEASTDLYGLINASWDIYDFQQNLSPEGWGSYPFYTPPYYRQNQKRGEQIPVYLDENQLRFLRDRSRKLCAENPFAQAALENRVNYAVGEEGFAIKAIVDPNIEDGGLEAQRYVNAAQRIVDRWYDYNNLPDIQEWLVNQPDLNGDGIVRHFFLDNGLVVHRPIEAEHLRSPSGAAYAPHYSFGIETDPEDIINIVGYWVIEDPIKSWTPAFVPRKEITHVKRHTSWSAKRGMPLFYSTELLLRSAMDLLRATISTAVVRAKFSVIRKFTNNIVKDAASKLINELATTTTTDPTTGQSLNVEKKPFGSVTNASPNVEYEFPGSNLDAGVFEVALQMVLRGVAARCHMPEWMFTADSSNANYSSSLVAEAPSTKAFTKLQKRLIKTVATSKTRGRESMAWLQLQHAVRCGYLDPDTLKVVALSCEGPSIVVRDKVGEAQTNSVYVQMGVKPKTMVQQELDIDPKKAKKMFEEEARDQVELQAIQSQLQLQTGQQPSTAPGVPNDEAGAPQADPNGGQTTTPDQAAGDSADAGEGVANSGVGANRASLYGSATLESELPGVINIPSLHGTVSKPKHTFIIPQERDRKFSCLLFNLRKGHWLNVDKTAKHPLVKVLEMVQRIPDGALADDGRQGESHITLKYGIHTDNPAKVNEIIRKYWNKPISVELGKTKFFAAGKDKDYDVVYIEVDSEDLRDLNKLISKQLDCTDTYTEYKPHLTLACVRKGKGEEFKNWADVDGCKFVFSEICFNDHDDLKSYISLVNDRATIGSDGHDYAGQEIKRQLMEQIREHKAYLQEHWIGLLEAGFTGIKHIQYQRGGTTVRVTQYWDNGKQIKKPSVEDAREHFKILHGEPSKHPEITIQHHEDIGHPREREAMRKAAEIGHAHEQGLRDLSKYEKELTPSRQTRREHVAAVNEFEQELSSAIDQIEQERQAASPPLDPEVEKQYWNDLFVALNPNEPKFGEGQHEHQAAWDALMQSEPTPAKTTAQKILATSKEVGLEVAEKTLRKGAPLISRSATFLVADAAIQRGIPPKQAVETALWLDAANEWYKFSVSDTLAHAVAEKLGGKKGAAAGFVLKSLPIGQLTYLAYSAIRNPIATLRAARNATIGNKLEHHERVFVPNMPGAPGTTVPRGFGTSSSTSSVGPQVSQFAKTTNIRERAANQKQWNHINQVLDYLQPGATVAANREKLTQIFYEIKNQGASGSDSWRLGNYEHTDGSTQPILVNIHQVAGALAHQDWLDAGYPPVRRVANLPVEQQPEYTGSSAAAPALNSSRTGMVYTQPGNKLWGTIRHRLRQFATMGVQPSSGNPRKKNPETYHKAFSTLHNKLLPYARHAGQPELNLAEYEEAFRDAINNAKGERVDLDLPGLGIVPGVNTRQLQKIVDWVDMDRQLGMQESYVPEPSESKQLLESLIEQNLIEAGFTGIVTDQNQHKHRFINGVPAPLGTDVNVSKPPHTAIVPNVRGMATKPAAIDSKGEPLPPTVAGTSSQQNYRDYGTDPDVSNIPEPLHQPNETVELLLHGKPLYKEPLTAGSGINEGKEFIDVGLGGFSLTKGVWKPATGEKVIVDSRFGSFPARAGIKKDLWRREVAASELGHLLELGDLVPVTVAKKMNGSIGSLQHYENGLEAGTALAVDVHVLTGRNVDSFSPDTVKGLKKDQQVIKNTQALFDGPKDLARTAAFDFLILNTDRHHQNWMLTSEDKPILIDNAFSFPDAPNYNDFINSHFLKRAIDLDMPIPPEVSNWGNKEKELVHTLQHVGLSEDEINFTLERFHSLVEGARLGMTFKQVWEESNIRYRMTELGI